jgi:CheY-like chemotaxis protein
VAHDFNNLLTVVLGNVAFLEKGLAKAGIDGKLTQRLGYMRAAAERGARLTDQLLSFSRRQRLVPKVIDLNEAVAGMRDLLQSTMGGSIRIETELGDDLWPALVDLTQLELAVLNLSINARDAMEMGGRLSVGTANVELGPAFYTEEPPAGDYVAVHVTDTGVGMSKDVRSKAFEPFFTTKEIGKGSGLGLSQVLGFAKQSGGGVRIRSDPGEGTSIEIFLPRADVRPVKTETLPARRGAMLKASARLILVDDDNAVREVTAATLRELGYTVLEAGSGGAALELLEHSVNVDLMLIDFAMPGMSGAEVARRVQTTRPSLPILFVTGYADRAALEGVSEAQIIGKPFVDNELHEKVRTALARRAPGRVVRLRPC